MFEALRYYWIAARGYRLHPWDSPYIRWRFETFSVLRLRRWMPVSFFVSPGSTAPKWKIY